MKDWNEGQREGILTNAENVLISAGAGAGKTAVLVERLIRRLTDQESPLGMDQFLFVTFTNAAAQEMMHRVRQGIEERYLHNPSDRRLAGQRQLLGQAAISTLHGFCLDLIRRYYKDLGIDPESRVLSEPEQILLQGEILDAYLEECYERNDTGFAALTAVYGGERSDAGFRDLIRRVYSFAVAQPQPLAWLRDSVKLYRKDASAQDLIVRLQELAAESLQWIIKELDKGIALSARLPSLQKYQICLEEDREKLRRISEKKDWDAFVEAIGKGTTVFGRLPSLQTKIGKNEELEAYEARCVLQPRIKEIREQCKKQYGSLTGIFIEASRENLESEIEWMAPVMIALSLLVSGFCERYSEVKRDKSVLDFGDIEHYAVSLLYDENGAVTGLAESLRRRYQEILVDEYQDINPVQEAIIQALRGERLLLVGDVKQSIYGFRQAAPRLFLDKYRKFQTGEGCALITLAQSYRSSQWIVGGINQVFDRCMTLDAGGIDYQKEARLLCAFQTPEEAKPEREEASGQGVLELHFIALPHKNAEPRAEADAVPRAESESESETQPDTAPDTEPKEPEEEDAEPAEADGDSPGFESDGEWETLPALNVLQAEAAFCARRIRALMRENVWDKETKEIRRIRYRDIVILLRAMNGVADVLAETLYSQGIPVFTDIGGGYFKAQEVQTALNFLRILDNPRQDIPLAALMLSPAYGFTGEELSRIKVGHQNARRRAGNTGSRSGRWGGLYKALVYASANEEAIGVKGVGAFLGALKEYRRYARRVPVSDVLLRFYEETGFLNMSAAMSGGAQRRANLLALIQRAQEYEETNLQGLYSFIRYIETMGKRGTDLTVAPVIGEGEDVVRIMSIHKSKGLEFPVVLLATAGRRFNHRSSQSDLLLHETLGMASKIIQASRRVKYAGLYHSLVADKLRKESVAEQMRLLYVAMTRAEQRLIVLAADKQAEKWWSEWGEDAYDAAGGDAYGLRADSYAQWLGPAVLSRRDSPYWSSHLWSMEEIMAREEIRLQEKDLWQTVLLAPGSIPAEPESADKDGKWAFIGEQLAWRYPWKWAGEAAAKMSVTQAKGRIYPEQDADAGEMPWSNADDQLRWEGPAFLNGKQAMSAAQRGTLLHRIIARMRPQKAAAQMQTYKTQGMTDSEAAGQYLETLAQELVVRGFLSAAEKEACDTRVLIPFLSSDLFRRMCIADTRGSLRQEASFTMAAPADRLYPELTGAEESVVLQGTIDAYFEEEGRLILIDYKSDRVAPGREDELLRRYGGQLRLYGEALEAITGKKVAEMILYAFASSKELCLDI